MKKVTYKRDVMKTDTDSHNTVWFAAANGSSGFRSYFDEIFDPKKFTRIYIIKGGPGTGKSRLMRKIASEFENKEGISTEKILCSSDTNSLDGIIISNGSVRIALMDGTAPHICDVSHPGFCENIINLGDNWDADKLVSKKDEILELMKRKNNEFRSAYSALSCADSPIKMKMEIAKSFTKEAKLSASIEKIIRILKKELSTKESNRVLSAISTQGYVTLDTLDQVAKKYFVMDFGGSAWVYLSKLREILALNNKTIVTITSPLSENIIFAIYLPMDDTAFICCDKRHDSGNDIYINTKRFIDNEIYRSQKNDLSKLEQIISTSVALGIEHLESAGKYHAKIENIYVSSMDFSKNNVILDKLSKDLHSLLKI